MGKHKRIMKATKRWVIILVSIILLASIIVLPEKSQAADFSMKTGYYMGTGTGSTAISGVGFQPDLVIIKSSTAAGVAVFKSSAMAAANTAYMSATADNTASQLTLNSDGFTIGTLANLNSVNVLYTWTAFTGSDCSASGNYCVGVYTGDGAASKTITTGFQPGLVIVKRSTAVAAHFRTASMATGRTEFFTSTAANTAGAYINSFAATSFAVGTTNNASGGTYYYIAYKAGGTNFTEGTYSGDGLDNRNITGLGFTPSFVLVKNSTSTTTNNRRSVMSTVQHLGDSSSYVGDAVADGTNAIQSLSSGSFQVGTGVNVNASGNTMYWFAFGGDPGPSSASGDFLMDTGTYTGTGVSQSITGISFAPDLVMIKAGDAATYTVFRTRMMYGDNTAYLANAVANFAGGITALNSNGFTVGTDTSVNGSGTTYEWQAFGNAYNPYTNSGASNFAIGAFYGNGADNRNINVIPFQPDMVTLKRNGASIGMFRLSSYAGDLTSFFGASAETSNCIQALNTTGFQVGSNAVSNSNVNLHYWFAFKEGSYVDVGSYTGNGTSQTITNGFSPDLAWVKRSTAVSAVSRPDTLSGDQTQYFTNTVNAADRITALGGTGFSVGTQTEVNTSTGTYRYIAWRKPPLGVLSLSIVDSGGTPVSSPSFSMNSLGLPIECTANNGELGTSSQRIRVSNLSANPAWTVTIAATDGTTALWRNGGNTEQYDFNDPSGSPNGCSDGGDSDSKTGQLEIKASTGSLTAEAGCSTSDISLGSDQKFHENTTDTITLLTAGSAADTNCYWDLIGIDLTQYVPNEQLPDSYNLNFTITSVAS